VPKIKRAYQLSNYLKNAQSVNLFQFWRVAPSRGPLKPSGRVNRQNGVHA
jgi:hypothetical protein